MSDIIKSVATYKLAILIGLFFTVNALGISIISALSGVDHWSQLTVTQQIVIISSGLVNRTNTLLAFLNKTLSRIESGKPPIETGDTQNPFKPETKI